MLFTCGQRVVRRATIVRVFMVIMVVLATINFVVSAMFGDLVFFICIRLCAVNMLIVARDTAHLHVYIELVPHY